MGKTYIDTVKYVVYASVEIDGLVEKPDVVGAIFGQTEGLLGDELDLRELQKSGRIGRIEVNIKPKSGKSVGEIILPSSLDKVETSILAAALETVDRVGPCEAKIKVKKIEDTRSMKREHVVDRAKNILKSMMDEITPERKEISGLVRDEARIADIESFGPEKLAAGPNVTEAENIIVVEGRADVINLLKCDIRNVIAMQGKIIPQTIIDLSKEKNITVFIDGDRGGDLIIKQLADCAEIDYVAKAPDGKEVEELTKKEVIKCLRNKIPFDTFIERISERRGYRPRPPVRRKAYTRAEPRTRVREARINPYEKKLKELEGTLRGVLLDSEGNAISEADVKDISDEIEKQGDGIDTVVFDGIITQRLVDIANKNHVKNIVGVRKSRIDNRGEINIFTSS